jgi:imidazolonepropionase-like amidohydrolase
MHSVSPGSAVRSIVSFAALLLGIAASSEAADSWLIPADKIYPAPGSPPISHGAVLTWNQAIEAVDTGNVRRRVSKSTKTATECRGVVVAGFQNSHVHFIEPRFRGAASLPADQLSRDLEAMLTMWGFTTVFDVASDQQNTLALRKRIESGDVRGPRIRTVGLAFFPVDGLPSYINDLPADVLARMHQPRSADEARANVRANIGAGADGTKLFMQTSPARDTMRWLTPEVARAAVDESHAQGKPAFAHPTSLAGLELAVDSGVDIIVHTTLGEPKIWDAGVVKKMVEKHVAVIPTFELWYYELAKESVPAEVVDKLVDATLEELRAFRAAGGQVLFGTDVGYMHAYDTAREFELMAKAGMSADDILASLTTAPAARWKDAMLGRVAPGYQADLVVLGGDPAEDVKNFANVRCVFRAGKLIYASAGSP